MDLLLEGEGRDLAEASKVIAGEEGEVLGVGIYREKWGESPVCYLRFRGADPDRVAALLKGKGYTVLGIYV